jgi:hypothetical protein
MTSKQYRRAIETLGLTQVAAAKFFGVSDRQSRYWAADGAPPMVEIILRIMLAKRMTVEEVETIVRRTKE